MCWNFLIRKICLIANPVDTPTDTQSKPDNDETLVTNPTLYQSLAARLQYLTFTHLDLSFAIQKICLFMHDPQELYIYDLKCVLRFVSCTLDYGLQTHPSYTTGLIAYFDANWGDVSPHAVLGVDIVSSWVTTSNLGRPNGNKLSFTPAPKQNNKELQMSQPKHVGFATFYVSFTPKSPKKPFSIGIT